MKTNNLLRLMPTLTALALPAVIGFGTSEIEAAQQQEVPVVVTIADPSDLAGVHIFSDGLGAYNQRVDRQVKSFIGLDGQLRFHTYDSPTRSLKVDFSNYAGVNGALPFSNAQNVQGNIVTLGEDTDNNGVLTAKQLDPGLKGERFNLLNSNFLIGQVRRIGLQVTFPIVSGRTVQNWRVRWGGGETIAGVVAVQRLSMTAWMIYSGDNDPPAVGLASGAPVGVYSMPFCLLIQIAD